MLRVGIIGCGNIAEVHAKALSKMEEVRICGFADPITERAKRYQKLYGNSESHTYESLGKLIAHEKPDVIHLCTPHALHVPMAITALGQGIHVFMEKPPAVTTEQFEELCRAEHESQARLGICFQNRYNLTTGKANELIRDKNPGKLLGGRAFVTWRRDASYYEGDTWKGSMEQEGGSALINQAIHSLDLLLTWLGEPASVEATISNHHLQDVIDTEDTCEAYLTFPDGARACLYASNAWVEDAPVLLELVFENGRIRIEDDTVTYTDKATGQKETFSFAFKEDGTKRYWGEGHARCIADFYEKVQNGRPYRNDLSSVKNTFRTVMNIYEAAGRKS